MLAGATRGLLLLASACVADMPDTPTQVQGPSQLLFEEKFEDVNLQARGWYDLAEGTLSSSTSEQHAPGSGRSLQLNFRRGATSSSPRVGARRLFPESESVYLRYWVRYSDNWVGSGKPYHPHEFYLMTNVDPQLVGPSVTHLTVYVEHNQQAAGGIGVLAIQDAENVDAAHIGANRSEKRAVAGCNGDPGPDKGECYRAGGKYVNGRTWRSSRPAFVRGRGAELGGWHKVEAFVRLNSLKSGRGQADGIARLSVDGELVINRADVLYRTAAHPGMKFRQILFAPYIGDGSPVDQVAWYDDIVAMTGPPE